MTSIAQPAEGHTRSHRVNWTVLALTSFAIAVYFPLQYVAGSLETLADANVGLAPVYADRPLIIQIVFYAHIAFAGIALLLGPFQFSRTIRHRYVRVHHAIGRIYIVCVVIGGCAAFVMAFFSSVGFLGLFGFGSLAVLWVFTTVTAYRAIRRRDFVSHQAWMIRSFALSYAAPMLRAWLFALLIPQVLLGIPFDDAYTAAYLPVPFLCWLPNIVIAELIIKRRGLPAFHLTDHANPEFSADTTNAPTRKVR